MHRRTASCVEPWMPSDRDGRRVPPNGDDSKNGSECCPSQPSPATSAPRRSPNSSRCHQRRSAAGRRRAGCPSSAPWAATVATPTPRSGPCWKPCPSYPRPASRAPRPTTPASPLTWLGGRSESSSARSGRVGPGHGRLPPCEICTGPSRKELHGVEDREDARDKPSGQWPSMAESALMILHCLRAGSPVVTHTGCCPSAAPMQSPRILGTHSESPAQIIPAA
jgi:hypothetical protein